MCSSKTEGFVLSMVGEDIHGKRKEFIVLGLYQFLKIYFWPLLNLSQDPGWSMRVVTAKRAVNRPIEPNSLEFQVSY